MNEHGFIKAIHNKVHPDVHKWKIHDTFTGGVPDVMYSGPAGVLFVEYKYIKQLPVKDTTLIRHSLSPQQNQWLERMNVSATSALIIGVGATAIIIQKDFMQNISKMKYTAGNCSRQSVADWIYKVTITDH